jgi:uncharacterized protein (DUF58 family)
VIRPTLRAVLLLLAGLPVAVLPGVVDARLWPSWMLFVVVALALAGIDALLVLPPKACRIRARMPAILYMGDQGVGTLELQTDRWKRPSDLELLAELDEKLVEQAERRVVLAPGEPVEVGIPLIPRRRGEASIGPVWVRARGPFGLMQRSWETALDATVSIVPNVRAVHSAALEFYGERTAVSGLKTERYIGDGSEFDSLRKFTRGFESSAIDWKASAKHRTLLCKTYRAERNHQVIIAFDTGRLMGEPLAGIPRIDHAVNAGLLLCYVCLKTGDRVGLFSFDSRPAAYLPPKRGVSAFARFQQRSAELEYTTEETNFTLGITDLLQRVGRRSLVVVFTDFVDSVTAELMVSNLEHLSRRHVVLFVALQDPLLLELTEQMPSTVRQVHRAVIAADLQQDRQLVLKRLGRAGVYCLDTQASDVSTRLLNQYLEIRRRELV